MSSILSEDPSFFSFDDPAMDISEFFATDELILSDGFGMDSSHTIPSPPEVRRNELHHHLHLHHHLQQHEGYSQYCPQPMVGGEESGPEGEDHSALGSCCSSSSSTPSSQQCSADEGWTKEDTLRLTDLIKFYGLNWQEIAKSFDGRTHTPEACQQQYQNLIDYVTKQNQLQLETADESDPSTSPSPSCEFLFSSPGDGSCGGSIDPFIMQGLDDDDNEVVMEMGSLGDYHPGAHYHQRQMTLGASMNNASLLEMNPLSAIGGMKMESYMHPSDMDGHHLHQAQPIAAEEPSEPVNVSPPAVSRKRKAPSSATKKSSSSSAKSSSASSSSSSKKTSSSSSSSKSKKKAVRRIEKEKRRELKRRKREAKKKIKEKKALEAASAPLAGAEAPTTATTAKKPSKNKRKSESKTKSESKKNNHKSGRSSKSSSSSKKREQAEQMTLVQMPHQEPQQQTSLHCKAKLEPPCEIVKASDVEPAKLVALARDGKAATTTTTATTTAKVTNNKKKSKSKPKTPKIKIEPPEAICPPAPIGSSNAHTPPPPLPLTPMMTTFAPAPSSHSSSARESASSTSAVKSVSVSLSSPTMMSLVQFQQRAGPSVLTQQRMLYPMLMPKLQPSPLSCEAPASISTTAPIFTAPRTSCDVHPPTTLTASFVASPSSFNSPSAATIPTSFASSSRSMVALPMVPIASSSPSETHSTAVPTSLGSVATTALLQRTPTAPQPVHAAFAGARSAVPASSAIAPMTAASPAPAFHHSLASAIAPSGCATPRSDPAGGVILSPSSATPMSSMTAAADLAAANLKRKKSCGDDKPDLAGTPTEEGAESSAAKKRKRRTAAEIERKFKCEMPNCAKSYGSEGALKMHVKLKHPGVKQPALKSPSSAPTRPNPPTTLPLLLQFPMPFMPSLMGSQQPIFPAPAPGSAAAAMVAAHAAVTAATNSALSSAVANSISNSRANALTPSPLTFAPTSSSSSTAPTSTFMPSLSPLPSSMSAFASSTPSSSYSPSPLSSASTSISSGPASAFLPAAMGRGSHSVAKMPNSFLANVASPSGFSSFSVKPQVSSSPTTSILAYAQTPAPAPSRFQVHAGAVAPSAIAELVPIKTEATPQVVVPTLISDLDGPSSALSAMTCRLQQVLAPAAGNLYDAQLTALLSCKVEIIDAETAMAAGPQSGSSSAYSSRASSPSLESDDISSSTSTSPSPMSPAVSAADLLMDTLGDCMLSLPQAMLMDEESAFDDCCDLGGDHNSVDTGCALDTSASGSNAAAATATSASSTTGDNSPLQRERVQAGAAHTTFHPLSFDGGEFLRQADASGLLAGESETSKPPAVQHVDALHQTSAVDVFAYGSNLHHHHQHQHSREAFPDNGFFTDGLNNDPAPSSSLSQHAIDSL